MRNITILAIITLVLTFTVHICAGAVIHGAVYNWENLKPLPKAVIIVNTTPEQKYVTPDGRYSFNLPPGHYVIKAYYYKSGKVVLYAEDNITIKKNGSYILDLILFPPLNVNVSQPNVEFPSVSENTGSNTQYIYALVLFAAIIGSIAFVVYFKRKRSIKDVQNVHVSDKAKAVGDESLSEYEGYGERREYSMHIEKFKEVSGNKEVEHDEVEVKREEQETVLEKEIQLLPEDLKEALEEIAKAGGRITQKELRKKLKYSEAKVSLLLTDLERRGYIEKVKKGRGNVIFLKDEYRKVFGL